MRRLTSIFIMLGMVFGLFACNKEECEDLVPGKVADRLVTDGWSCNSVEILLLGTIGFYQAQCIETLHADQDYQWHCGQHNHFSVAELEQLCLDGLTEFISRCDLQGQRISIEAAEIRSPQNYSDPSYALD